MSRVPDRPAHDAKYAQTIARVEGVHHDIRELLDELAHAPDFAALARGLRSLPQTLAEHFAEEEAPDGLYDGLRRRHPAVDSELEHLREDHDVLRERVDALVARVQAPGAGNGSAGELASLRDEAAAFIERLRRHERIETRLVSEIYYSENGGSG